MLRLSTSYRLSTTYTCEVLVPIPHDVVEVGGQHVGDEHARRPEDEVRHVLALAEGEQLGRPPFGDPKLYVVPAERRMRWLELVLRREVVPVVSSLPSETCPNTVCCEQGRGQRGGRRFSV